MHLPRVVALAGLAVLAVAAGVVYAIIGGDGNREAAAACAADAGRLAAMQERIGGEVAAVQVAEAAAPLPALAFKAGDGAGRTLADWAGKVTLVNLWATWCVPCREEMPDFDALKADYGGEDFDVVAISLDRGEPDVPAAFLKEIGVENLALYTDRESATFDTLKKEGLAFGLPSTLIVDEAGCRIGSIVGPAKWDSADGRALIEAALGR
jgi:thiol-disulfide isomerase/thioredoxin